MNTSTHNAVSTRERPSSALTKNKILIAAETLFSEKGYNATSIRDVALRSGSNSALISYYFGNKEGLKLALLEKNRQDIEKLFNKISHTKPSPKDLKNIIQQVLGSIDKNPSLFRSYLWTALEGGSTSQMVAEKVWSPFLSKMGYLIEQITVQKLTADERMARCFILCGLFNQYASLRWHSLDYLTHKARKEKILKIFRKNIEERVLDALLK